jgi:hypothetical protein
MSIFGEILKGALDITALPLKIGEEIMGEAVGTDGRGLKEALPVPSDITDKLKAVVEKADRPGGQ